MGMMQYDGDLLLPKNFLVAPPEIKKTSGVGHRRGKEARRGANAMNERRRRTSAV